MTTFGPRPPRRIVLVAGSSGSGKGELARRCGVPTLDLDEFYREADSPGLPGRFGIVDWDDPASWDTGAALEALTALVHDGAADIPVYSIARSRRIGTRRVTAEDAPLIIAEGIFAAQLVAPLAAADLLADALVLDRPVPLVFIIRLLRDLREHRKPPLTLLRRGWAQARTQHADTRRWARAGMRPLRLRAAARQLQRRTLLAEAERHMAAHRAGRTVLDITAVCFLRQRPHGTEVLAVRKRGTGSYMQVGGKIDPGESARGAAVREVGEELGVLLDPESLELLGEFEAAAANEPDTIVRSTVFATRAPLPDPLVVQAELADHRWLPVDGPGTGIRLAPLMVGHILPALRRL